MKKRELNDLIGHRLRHLREQRSLSLDQAAQLTGVSKPMLGQIERGQSNPTVSTLWKIADGLGVPFTAFLEKEGPEVKYVSQKELTPINEADDKYKVYPVFPMLPGKFFEIFTVTLEPGCQYHAKPHPRGVEEYVWVTEGETTIIINEEQFVIGKEEGISFKADRNHTYLNEKQAISNIVMVIYYPQ